MDNKLEKILNLVQNNPVDFCRFSEDNHQINPESRIKSISNIISKINIPKHSTILDIGTGYGYGAVLLNALGYNAIGVEINEAKLKEGMGYWSKLGIDFEFTNDLSSVINSSGKLAFSARDSKNLSDIPNSSIDMVTSFYLSGYMVGKNGAYCGVERILKPKGNLVVTTQGYPNTPEFLKEFTVNLMGKFMEPKYLKLTSTLTINDPLVHDKFVLVYNKSNKYKKE
ncbi:class I SAM-dependent methyltransferase [Candidatus Woesearchaeota archaeon]|nr:class I SAM-dependent methyltransferase [Candidatus Woesearchaeota archaeon]